MLYTIILALGIVILLVIVLRRQPFPIKSLTGLSKGLFYIALVLIGLYTAFFLMFGIGEMTGGDLSGAAHLLPAAALIVMIWIAWRAPFEAGLALIIIGLLASGFFIFAGWGSGSPVNTGLIYGGLPFLVPGVLLLLAVRDRWKSQPS
jgi:hypothetical protein